MNTHTFRAALAAIVAALTLAAANSAVAQINNPGCCSFIVNASCNLGAGCFPITITTTWTGGASQTDSKAGCSATTFTIANCPPQPAQLTGLTIDGNAITVGTWPPTATRITLACGTCVDVKIGFDPTTGCIRIQISPC